MNSIKENINNINIILKSDKCYEEFEKFLSEFTEFSTTEMTENFKDDYLTVLGF